VPTIVLRIDPEQLDNPDADLRYKLTDLLTERSAAITDDGYDYVGEQPLLVLFLKASKLEAALACVLDVVENERVLGNDLQRAVVVAVRSRNRDKVVYPPGFAGPFLPE
jgi:hypothetical protein